MLRKRLYVLLSDKCLEGVGEGVVQNTHDREVTTRIFNAITFEPNSFCFFALKNKLVLNLGQWKSKDCSHVFPLFVNKKTCSVPTKHRNLVMIVLVIWNTDNLNFRKTRCLFTIKNISKKSHGIRHWLMLFPLLLA